MSLSHCVYSLWSGLSGRLALFQGKVFFNKKIYAKKMLDIDYLAYTYQHIKCCDDGCTVQSGSLDMMQFRCNLTQNRNLFVDIKYGGQ